MKHMMRFFPLAMIFLAPMVPNLAFAASPGDASGYAQRMAERVLPRSDCDRFRSAIVEAGKGPWPAGSTATAIGSAYEAAKAAGCAKPPAATLADAPGSSVGKALVAPLEVKDASAYAAKMAALIDSRPECQRFRDDILAQSKNSIYAGSTMAAIGAAKQKANAASCSHP